MAFGAIDSLFTDLADLGWLINNLYQHDDGSWRANIRRPAPSGDWFTEWAEAPTLAEVLEDCMSKLNDAEFTAEADTIAIAAPKVDLAAVLGLVPQARITRR